MSVSFGGVTLRHGLMLAPMAGATDLSFRELCRLHGAEYTVTEMISAKALVLEALEKFNRESGTTIVMISSELEELRQICDRIAIVSGGRIAGILPATDSSEDFGTLMVSQVV